MGWGCCLKGLRVSSEVAAAAVTGLAAENSAAAVVQVDADVAAPHC